MALKITLGDLLHDCAARFADRPFVTVAETGGIHSHAEFERLTNRIAHGLRDRFGATLDYAAIVRQDDHTQRVFTCFGILIDKPQFPHCDQHAPRHRAGHTKALDPTLGIGQGKLPCRRGPTHEGPATRRGRGSVSHAKRIGELVRTRLRIDPANGAS